MSKVIKFKKRKVEVNYNKIYLNNLVKVIESTIDNDSHEYRVKLLYYSVKYINTLNRDQLTVDTAKTTLNFIHGVKMLLVEFTPRQLMNVFPVEKRYDGEKWEIKDYYYTMNELKGIGLDNKIGEKVDDVLWDYQNDDLFEFSANEFSIASSLKKIKTGKSIGEEWAEEMGIPTYTTVADGRGGTKIIETPRKKGSHLKVVK